PSWACSYRRVRSPRRSTAPIRLRTWRMRCVTWAMEARQARWSSFRRPAGGSSDADLSLHPLLVALTSFDRFRFPALRGGGRHERVEQPPGGLRDLVDRLVKRLGVSARRAGRTADLSHELQRGLPHLIVSCRWLKIME